MSLQPPRDESLNGLLQGYRIYYRELEPEAASAPESKTLRTPSALRTELAGELRPCLPRGAAGGHRGDGRRPLPRRRALRRGRSRSRSLDQRGERLSPAPLRLLLSPAVAQRRGGPGSWLPRVLTPVPWLPRQPRAASRP